MRSTAARRYHCSLMFALLIIAFAALFGARGLPPAPLQPVDAVNPLVGTANNGETFPSAGVPFSMTDWTPQTRDGDRKCVPPYVFTDGRIEGFRGSHYLSGSCTQDYGSVTLMPLTGTVKLGAEERSSAFSHSQETATPYRYQVYLSDYGVHVEITGTLHAGMMRFTPQRAGRMWVVVQCNSHRGQGRVGVDAADREVTCVNPVQRLYAGGGRSAGFSGNSVAQFDHAFEPGGTWSGHERHVGSIVQTGVNGAPGAWLSFQLKPGESLEARVGTSFTSLGEAGRNLHAEIPYWNFDQVEAQARTAWSAALGALQVQGDPTKERIFYTGLFHALLLPRTCSDVDGAYPQFAGHGKVETARGFTYYCDFSIWDTFRAVHPLLTILDPGRDLDMVRSLIAKGQEGTFLPIYPAWNSYTSEMIGDHADAVIADAWFKGIRGFNAQEAYRLMRQNATKLPAAHAAYVDGMGRRGLESYLRYGYIPLEDSVPFAFHRDEQVSRTMEYAYDDFLVGKMAEALGKEQDAALFRGRAQNYRNVIDPQDGFARGRHADGQWVKPFDPAKPASWITEGLPWQYTFFVPQDIPGLIALEGGKAAFISKLDRLFAGGYYNGGNEPDQQIPYLYDNAGAAWKTQEHVRALMETLYSDNPGGLPGNDDCGQMSAWYVFSALGFYPVTPGIPNYEIGTPLFDDVRIRLPGGQVFQIVARGAAAGDTYIQSATLNGVPLNRPWITHEEIVKGGELVFHMSAHRNPHWAAGDSQ